MPMAAVYRQLGREGADYIVAVQAGLHVSIFCHILLIVISDETAVLELPESGNRENRQGQANQYRHQILLPIYLRV